MSRPNTYVQLMNAKKEIAQLNASVEMMKAFTLRQAEDMAIITLHEHFGFGPSKCKTFSDEFMKTFKEYATLCVEDGEADEEIVYTQAVVDRALRDAMGEILPFEERYAPKNLYFRDRDLKKEDDHNE